MRYSEVAICVLLSACAAFSQTDRGSITGAITDASNAAVPGAAIEVKSQTTGAIYRGGASATGNYFLTGLLAGEYTLSVTAPGFKKFVRENITVEVATNSRVDARLEIGPAAEAVLISESEPLIKTESGELSHTVAGELAGRLPLLTIGTTQSFGSIRNPLQVVNLLGGALFSPDSILRVNGLPSNSQAIRIEGQDSTNGIWRQIDSLTQAGMDAVQEVAIQTSNAAEFGQAAGGYFNFTMKSGANRFHGVAYDYFVNEVFNAGYRTPMRAIRTRSNRGSTFAPASVATISASLLAARSISPGFTMAGTDRFSFSISSNSAKFRASATPSTRFPPRPTGKAISRRQSRSAPP